MLVSFVIPHKGREELLERTIDSISKQDFDLNQVEVIVCSQNPEEPSLESFRAVLPNIRAVMCDESLTISALRNRGVSHSSGQYLAFLDADIYLSENWIKSMQATLETRPSTSLSSAMQICRSEATPLEKIRCALSNPNTDTAVQFLPGRNLFLSRDTFKQSGGFPEHLVTCEDYYFTGKVSELGDLYYTSEAQYDHLGEDKHYPDFFSKEIWRGQSNLHSLKGRKIPLEELPSFLTPVWILFFSIIFLASLVVADSFLWPLSFALLTALPIGLYSLRLFRLGSGAYSFRECLKFYFVYFPARIIGTLTGLFKIVNLK